MENNNDYNVLQKHILKQGREEFMKDIAPVEKIMSSVFKKYNIKRNHAILDELRFTNPYNQYDAVWNMGKDDLKSLDEVIIKRFLEKTKIMDTEKKKVNIVMRVWNKIKKLRKA